MNKYRRNRRQCCQNDRHTNCAEQPLFALILGCNVGFQVFRSRDFPCARIKNTQAAPRVVPKKGIMIPIKVSICLTAFVLQYYLFLLNPASSRYSGCSFKSPSFPRRNAEPTFLFVYLHIVKARLLQIRLQLGVLVDGHAADDLRPLLVLVRIAVAFVADE